MCCCEPDVKSVQTQGPRILSLAYDMETLKNIRKNRFLRYGLPFVTLLVGGSFGLKQFTQLRYAAKKGRTISDEEAQQLGVLKKEEKPTLENEYEKLMKEDLDTWQNIRGPRPWENSKEVQDQMRQELKQGQS